MGRRQRGASEDEPTVVTKFMLVQDAAGALMSDIGDPDAADGEASRCDTTKYLLPQRLIQLLDAISQGDLAWAGFTLGKPLAWAAMMVTSPGLGVGLSVGMYCFTAR